MLFMMMQLMQEPYPIQLSAGYFNRFSISLYTLFILFSLVHLVAEGGVEQKTEKQSLRGKHL